VKTVLKMCLISALALPACNRNTPNTTRAAPEERTTANANANEQLKQERDDYVTNMNAKLAEFDQKVDGLDERATAMKGPGKDQFKNAITQLRDQRKDVARKLDDLKGVNAESWQTMKGQVDSSFAQLEKSYDQVSKQYEKEGTGAGRKTS
jgi:uncharacterized coiled-coil DUF342 family protein